MAEAGRERGDLARPNVPDSPGRRAFLRLAAAAGGATLLSSCTGTSGRTTGSGTAGAANTTASGTAGRIAAPSGPPSAADWTALAQDLSQPLVRPGDAGYTTAKELFDPRFDSLHPAGIAYCRDPARRGDLPGLRAQVRRTGGRPLRRSQLRRVVDLPAA